MDMSFKEKSLWIQIASLALVFGGYFLNVDQPTNNSLPPNLTGQFIALVVALIVLNILAHILAAVFNKPEIEDERDRLIELKASRIKAFLLGAGIVITTLVSLRFENLFVAINLLVLCLVIAEIADKAMQLFYYRKGI